MDDMKRCCKCKMDCLKTNFHKDGLFSQCKSCVIQRQKMYDCENREKVLIRNKEYQLKNHDTIIAQKKIYSNNKYKSDINFRLICRTRNRICQALKCMMKQSSSRDILAIAIDTYKKWLEFQFTPEMNWSNIEIDHVKRICMFDVIKDEELREAFNWKNNQPLLKHDHQQKGIKFNFLDYQLQFIKTYQFLRLTDQEG